MAKMKQGAAGVISVALIALQICVAAPARSAVLHGKLVLSDITLGLGSVIYLHDLDTGETETLFRGRGSVTSVQWSPDGTRVLYDFTDRGIPSRAVFVLDVATGESTRITQAAEGVRPDGQAWSPDGSRVVVCTHDAFSRGVVYTVDMATLATTTLYDEPGNYSYPAWSGHNEIAFVGYQGAQLLWKMESDLRTAAPLDTDLWGYDPDWSPDSRRLVFVSNRDGNSELFVSDADGRQRKPLTRNKLLESSPVWTPDGQHIAFVSGLNGNTIQVVDTDGDEVEAFVPPFTRSAITDFDLYDPSRAVSPVGRSVTTWGSLKRR